MGSPTKKTKTIRKNKRKKAGKDRKKEIKKNPLKPLSLDV